jgi:hypothetical protein
MTSTYHEHASPLCDPGPNQSCPTPAGTIYCEQIDEDLFGCTHVTDVTLTGAPLQTLARSLAASYRAASILQAAEAEPGGGAAEGDARTRT